ncbi:N-acetylserotonin O-methyltransferase [Hibiscus trionum]|uniref:N-acetylserotonin O-methyltransferase n=1 Tax=Hibiscus trionum TaxID=183268 RepID=A0A9W7HNB7_HIBTR|nr:N-acetylserotonin O-methyltransferase [Hibiscus trionum]
MDKVNVNGENGNELLQAQAHLWNHIFSFINSMSFQCAIDLDIPDIIQKHGKPMTITKLVVALPTLHPTKACNIYRLMRILVHSGFFVEQKLGDGTDEDGYVLTGASRLLLKDNPLSVSPFLKSMLDPILLQPWHFLRAWSQNDDRTPFVTAHGEMLWDYCGHHPRVNNSFNEAMASDAQVVNSILIDKYNGGFEGLNSLVDVGGGTGTLGKAVADAFPHMECTVFDLPHVVAGQLDNGNLKYVGGNMFEGVPAADAVLLKWIMHDWSDEECVKILKHSKQAISSGGKVIIIDMVMMTNGKGKEELMETQLFIDMVMMVLMTGKERNEEEWAKLFSEAGFSGYKIIPILGLRSVIEVYP